MGPDSDGFVTKTVPVDINDLIGLDLEGFLDLLMERVGDPLGMDIAYGPVRVNDEGLIEIEVTYIPSQEDEDEDDDLCTECGEKPATDDYGMCDSCEQARLRELGHR